MLVSLPKPVAAFQDLARQHITGGARHRPHTVPSGTRRVVQLGSRPSQGPVVLANSRDPRIRSDGLCEILRYVLVDARSVPFADADNGQREQGVHRRKRQRAEESRAGRCGIAEICRDSRQAHTSTPAVSTAAM